MPISLRTAALLPTSPMPTWQYLVALNNNPADDPALITTVATPAGSLGARNVWTDITPWVMGHQYTRGRQHELSRFEAGTCTLDLGIGAANDSRFIPWNTSSPYTGKLLPMRPVQIRATYSGTTYTRYTGHVIAWPTLWPDPFSQYGQIQASDAFRYFALKNITSGRYASIVLADGATAYYRLGESVSGGQPTIALDSGPNPAPYNGTYAGTIIAGVQGALTGDLNTAVDFGNKAGYVSGNYAFTGTGGFSFECWFKAHALPSSGDLLYRQYIQAANLTIGFTGASGQLNMTATDGPNSASLASSSNLPNDGAYHHIVLTRASDGKTYTWYLDGVAAGSTVAASVVTINAGIGPYIAPSINGIMDEVTFYQGVTLSAAQALNHFASASGFVGSIQSSGPRINAVLDSIGWPLGARNIDTGNSTVQAVTTSLASTKALTYMQLVEQTEAGALFMTGDGKVRFIARQNLLFPPYTVSQATYGDNPGELSWWASPDLVLDDIDLWNEINVTRAGGVTQTAVDSSSQTSYGPRTQNLTGLLMTTDNEAADRANWNLNHYSQPLERLRKIEIHPLDDPTNLFPATLGRELLDRITVNRHGVPGGGTAFQTIALVERIEERVTVDSWVVTYGLSPADTQAYWVLGTSALDSTTRLGY